MKKMKKMKNTELSKRKRGTRKRQGNLIRPPPPPPQQRPGRREDAETGERRGEKRAGRTQENEVEERVALQVPPTTESQVRWQAKKAKKKKKKKALGFGKRGEAATSHKGKRKAGIFSVSS